MEMLFNFLFLKIEIYEKYSYYLWNPILDFGNMENVIWKLWEYFLKEVDFEKGYEVFGKLLSCY
jgi:hypothetical protein